MYTHIVRVIGMHIKVFLFSFPSPPFFVLLGISGGCDDAVAAVYGRDACGYCVCITLRNDGG